MHDKIIQLMPAAADTWAIDRCDNDGPEDPWFFEPILAWGLTESEDGSRLVEAFIYIEGTLEARTPAVGIRVGQDYATLHTGEVLVGKAAIEARALKGGNP